MRKIKKFLVYLLLLPAALAPQHSLKAYAKEQHVVVGVNLVNEPYKQTADEQESTLRSMNAAGVRAIRCGIPDTDKGLDFVQRVHDHGIKILWLTGPTPVAGTPWPQPPEGSKGFWRGYPLSKADPALSGANFKHLLDRLEGKKITLAGIEVRAIAAESN